MHENNKKHCPWQSIFAHKGSAEICHMCKRIRPEVYKACWEYPIYGSDNRERAWRK